MFDFGRVSKWARHERFDEINAQCPRMENKTHIEVYDHSDLYHS